MGNVGLDSIRWTFLKSRAEPEENVHDASASKAHLYPGMQSNGPVSWCGPAASQSRRCVGIWT
jgi:hypothetical protein